MNAVIFIWFDFQVDIFECLERAIKQVHIFNIDFAHYRVPFVSFLAATADKVFIPTTTIRRITAVAYA